MKRLSVLVLFIILVLSLTACDQLLTQVQPTQPPTIVVAPLETNTSQPKIVISTSTPTSVAVQAEYVTATPAAAAQEAVWVLNEADRKVNKIDPINHIITNEILIGGVPIDLAVYGNTVWVIEGIDDKRSNVLKIDKTINQIISSIPITHGAATSLVVSEDSVWVGIAEPVNPDEVTEGIEYIQKGGIVRIDPNANQVAEYIEAEAMVADLFLDGATLWTLNWLYTYTYFEKIDLVERVITTIPESVTSVEYVHEFAKMTKNSAGIWATPLASGAKAIFRINPEDGKIESIIEIESDADDQPVDLTATEEVIWVAMQNGKVVKIDPYSETVVEIYDIGGENFSEIFLASGSLWVSSYREAMLYQLNPENGEVIGAISTGNKPQPSPTPTLTATPDPAAAWTACEGTYESHLNVGVYAKVNEEPPVPNRVRVEPNSSSTILDYIYPGEIVEIIAGPTCTDGWVWWNVRSTSRGITGWTSEGDGNEYWLVPNN